jgi:hypothetical protein
VAGTVGGAVKGVLDTAGNTVGTLGSGVGDTVVGVTGGLADAAYQAGGAMKSAGQGGRDAAGDTASESVNTTREVEESGRKNAAKGMDATVNSG